MLRPAVFLDRDGTLMEEVDYCRDPKDVYVFAGVSKALRQLKEHGFLNILITNQAGIGRGYFTEEAYRRVHEEFLRQLGSDLLDGAYYCPDAPWQNSPRRKPEPGMVLEAIRDHHIDPARSFFIGDKDSDIECGKRAGVRTILVQTGYGAHPHNTQPDYKAKDIPSAVEIILSS